MIPRQDGSLVFHINVNIVILCIRIAWQTGGVKLQEFLVVLLEIFIKFWVTVSEFRQFQKVILAFLCLKVRTTRDYSQGEV